MYSASNCWGVRLVLIDSITIHSVNDRLMHEVASKHTSNILFKNIELFQSGTQKLLSMVIDNQDFPPSWWIDRADCFKETYMSRLLIVFFISIID